jgi:hypothetical protein
MTDERQEMTLRQWVEELPVSHRARREYQELLDGLDNSQDHIDTVTRMIQSMLQNQGFHVRPPPPPAIDPEDLVRLH